ncbi:MAG: GntR family transcriptional regulator [Clostridia bacterium]|nr:GntR family transcriptional regulator [Clostridia bacterium]
MLIHIDFESETPIYVQLRDQVVIGIANGSLDKGESLPSVRRMAADIGVHAHTVNKSYAMLRDEGYVVMDRRSGCHVRMEPQLPGEGFRTALEQKLLPLAAEAACHGQSAGDFGAMCAKILAELTELEGSS